MADRVIRRATPNTIVDKFLVGYQGWFTCGGDGQPVGPGHHGWLHWFNAPIPDGGRPTIDTWPDVSGYDQTELYEAPGLKKRNGEPVHVFSSRNPATVRRHFRWMAEHGVDGAFLQRFAGQIDREIPGNEGILRIRDEVGDLVRDAAEKEGRVWAIMYDISGVPADKLARIIERDWATLVYEKKILDSPYYLRENGKPVIGLWGLGLDPSHNPGHIYNLTYLLRSICPHGTGAYIFGGTPAFWRTASLGDIPENTNCDASPHIPAEVYMECFDTISPWTVGRFTTDKECELWGEGRMKGDADCIAKWNEERGNDGKVDYVPVALPGVSGYNLSEGNWTFNGVPRLGGRLLWQQIFNAKRVGAKTIYGAMWDEYDEGTAFMPVISHKHNLPQHDRYKFMALDEDGIDLPSDWYMRICGFGSEALKGERRIYESFPSKELHDYWSSRPKYETATTAGASGSAAAGSSSILPTPSAPVPAPERRNTEDGQTYEEWLAGQKEEKEDLPPPPYTLEADETPDPAPAAAPSTSAPAPVPIAAVPSGGPTVPVSAVPVQQTPSSHATPVVVPPSQPPSQAGGPSPLPHGQQAPFGQLASSYSGGGCAHPSQPQGPPASVNPAPTSAGQVQQGPHVVGQSSYATSGAYGSHPQGPSSPVQATTPVAQGQHTPFGAPQSTYPASGAYDSHPQGQPPTSPAQSGAPAAQGQQTTYGGPQSSYTVGAGAYGSHPQGQPSPNPPAQSGAIGHGQPPSGSSYNGPTSPYPPSGAAAAATNQRISYQPQHQSSYSYGQQNPSPAIAQDPAVAALASEFLRQNTITDSTPQQSSYGYGSAGIPPSSSPPPMTNTGLGRRPSASVAPPPIHPAHPSAASQGRISRPTTASGPPSTQSSRPTPSQGGPAQSSYGNPQGPYNPPSASGYPPSTPSQHPPTAPGGTSWQPASGWGATPSQSTGPPASSYGGGGASLSRPQTFSASSYNSGATSGPANVRPPASYIDSTSGPSTPAVTQPPTSFGLQQGSGPARPQSASGYGPGTPSTHGTPGCPTSQQPQRPPHGTASSYGFTPPGGSMGMPNFPSGPGAQGPSSQMGGSSGYPPQSWTQTSPPATPPAGAPTFPGSSHARPPYGTSAPKPGGAYPGASSITMPGLSIGPNDPSSMGLSFPTSPTLTGPGPSFPQTMPGAPGGYGSTMPSPGISFPGANPSGSTQGSHPSYQTFGTSMPTANPSGPPGGPNPGASGSGMPAPWLSGPGGTPGPSGPAMPPRPPTGAVANTGASSSGKLNFPIANPMAQNALNYTLGAVDKIAGKKTAAQLEGLMGSGAKLFGKFSKS